MPGAGYMPVPLWRLSVTGFGITLIGALVVSAGALWYFRRVRQERPPVGTFNSRDIGVLYVIIIALPFLYVALPHWAVTAFLAVTFTSALAIGYRPVLPGWPRWLGIGVLIGANLWTSRFLLGTVAGWQLWWLELTILVGLAAVAVANLYVQGGMGLGHVAWFSLGLAVYDVIFSEVVPVIDRLLGEFIGTPLDPSLGFRFGLDNYALGIGDVLVFCMFTIAAYKAYGWAAARLAFGMIAVFGVAAPAFTPLLINLIDPRGDVAIPVQAFFGPAAFLAYLWLRHRHGRERTMGEYLAGGGSRTAAVEQPARAGEPARV